MHFFFSLEPNKKKSYAKWLQTGRVGEQLANLTAAACAFQLQSGNHFVIENSQQSEIWQLESFQTLLSDSRVVQALLHQCQVGLVDPEGQLTKKPTLFVASRENVIRRLRRLCPNDHKHALLAGSTRGKSRCRYAQVWPQKLVELLVLGILETLSTKNVACLTSYPAVRQDPYGGRLPPPPSRTCPGCVARARRTDARHDRRVGIYRFPDDEAVIWDCPSCQMIRPSTHSGHNFSTGLPMDIRAHPSARLSTRP